MAKNLRWWLRQAVRVGTNALPKPMRFATYRSMIRCDAAPSPKLVLKLAETREELEACFRILHDAYVQTGLMDPDPSGMRVTVYHALPTTSTLLAKYGDEVVGTLSLVRESAMGFPLQRIFEIDAVRAAGGRVAEVSSLAVKRSFQSRGGIILFPLMKFMYEYATRCFDTRHLVIAVNPRHIGMYESLLFFKRLRPGPAVSYDFVNGNAAIGAHLDLKDAPEIYRRCYDRKPPEKNLYRYFTQVRLPNIVFPDKRFFTTNDPVMTPALIDYFFNQRTRVFAELDDRQKLLLHTIYDATDYAQVLPPLPTEARQRHVRLRRHPRFSVICPAQLLLDDGTRWSMRVTECSISGFRARVDTDLPVATQGLAQIDLGATEHSELRVRVLRESSKHTGVHVFRIEASDLPWRKFVRALQSAHTHGDLLSATRYL